MTFKHQLRDLPRNRRAIFQHGGLVVMNIFESMKQLLIGGEERNFQRLINGLLAQPMPRAGYYHRFSGKSKTFKKNRRRGL